jgi:hypothetical protein
MNTLIRIAVVLAIAALAVGCASREKQLIGKWSGKIAIPESEKDNPMAKMVEGMMSSLSLELKEDKSFIMTMMFPVEGTWSLVGNTLELKVSKFMGMTIDEAKEQAKKQGATQNLDSMNKPLRFEISADNKSLKAIKEDSKAIGADQGDLVFTKSES